MSHDAEVTLINPKTGALAFKVFSFDEVNPFDQLQRNNHYSLIWVVNGTGRVKADFSEYGLMENTLFAFCPYQPFMFLSGRISGVGIYFHPDFFCIHKHQEEVACNGVLFNNIYEPPFVHISPEPATTLEMLIRQLSNEAARPGLAQFELLVSYLKIFLITLSRLKAEQQTESREAFDSAKEPFILQDLRKAIEKDFKKKHAASDYARELNISAKALVKITKAHCNRTLTEMITERIIIEAKRELYLTGKTIKEIAYELGYDDEYYFSRFFKANASVSPQTYRNTVGFERGVE